MTVDIVEVFDKTIAEDGVISLIYMAGIGLMFMLEEDSEPWYGGHVLSVPSSCALC